MKNYHRKSKNSAVVPPIVSLYNSKQRKLIPRPLRLLEEFHTLNAFHISRVTNFNYTHNKLKFMK